MTVKELSQLYWLNREIELDQKRLEELEYKAIPGSPIISDMPPGPHSNESKVEKLAAEIADLKTKIFDNTRKRNELNAFIENIPDSLTRMIFTYRFKGGCRWKEVARLVGGRNNADGVKMICYRYLDKGAK